MKTRHAVLIALLLSTSVALGQDDNELARINTMADSGQTQNALDELDSLLANNPDNAAALYLQGVLLLEQGDDDAARSSFMNVLQFYPGAPEVHNNLAAIYARQGDYQRARDSLESALANDPAYATAQANLGDIYIKLAQDAYANAADASANGDPTTTEASQAKAKALDQLFEGS